MEKTYEPESQWLKWHDTPQGRRCLPLFCAPVLDGQEPPVYVDLGCAHPINKSLTHFVRDLGWRGVAVDGNGDYEKDWAQVGYRSHLFITVLSNKPSARFVTHENAFTSRISESEAMDRPEQWGIKRVEERQCLALESILLAFEIERIDLLTIDLEGAELEVLQTLDWERHNPSFIIAEYDTAGVGIDCRVCNWLLARGYEVVQMFPSNLIYRRK